MNPTQRVRLGIVSRRPTTIKPGDMPAPRIATLGGRWAELGIPMRSFLTLPEAGDYARARSHGRWPW